jgi:hypothetical protein
LHIVALPPPPQSSALVHFAAQACKARRSLCDARSLTTGPVGPRGAVPHGGVPEWLKGTDCKSVGDSLRWFKSNPLHQRLPDNRGYAGSLHTIDRAVVAHLDHSIAPETGMQLFESHSSRRGLPDESGRIFRCTGHQCGLEPRAASSRAGSHHRRSRRAFRLCRREAFLRSASRSRRRAHRGIDQPRGRASAPAAARRRVPAVRKRVLYFAAARHHGAG